MLFVFLPADNLRRLHGIWLRDGIVSSCPVHTSSLASALHDPSSVALMLAQLKMGLPLLDVHGFLMKLPVAIFVVSLSSTSFCCFHRILAGQMSKAF